jgi:N-acetylneuraminic acid mutarotase
MQVGRFLLALMVVFLQAGLVQAATSLLPAGSMAVKRFGHAAELLADGRVLVAGGGIAWDVNDHPTYTNTAEIYNPTTNVWSSAGTFTGARQPHFVHRLASGKVLIAGGETGYDLVNDHGIWTSTAVLYDPASNSWSAAGSMSHPHVFGASVLLGNGKVLVAGGTTDETAAAVPTNKFDLYDPATNSWSSGTMTTARADISCSRTFLLPSNGKVLVIGGRTGYNAVAQRGIHTATTEIYSPASNSWATAGSMSGPHDNARGHLLSNGKVFIAGGVNDSNVVTTLADRYDPATNSWSSAGSMSHPHYGQDQLALADDRLLITGGKTDTTAYSASTTLAEIYNPATNTWSAAGSMMHPHGSTWPVLLANGKVLIAGGMDDAYATTTAAEIYNPATNSWTAAGNMVTKRMGGFVTAVPGGKGMVFGGMLDVTYTSTRAADIYDPALNSWSVANLSEPKSILFSVTPFGSNGLLIAGGMGIAQAVYGSADKVVDGSTPVACGVPASITVPVADADGSYAVSWGASATTGATYELQEATNSTFTTGLRTIPLSALTTTITGRSQNTTYFYRVRAVKAGNTASAWRTAANGCAVPGTATAGAPASLTVPAADADGAYAVNWGASATAGVTYELQEATNSLFTTGLRSAYRGTATTFSITGRSQNVTYYYRVRAVKAGLKDSGYRGAANSCAVPGMATAGVPASITVPTADADGTYAVSWGASTTAGVTYELQEATASNFTTGLRTAYRGIAQTCNITGRSQNTTYYYRVRAVKAGLKDSGYRGVANSCAVPGTATSGIPASIVVPASDPDGVYTLSWGASTTAGVTYELQEATNNTFTTGLRLAYRGAALSTGITGRSAGTIYYYRVRAVKGGLKDSAYRTGGNGCLTGS